MLMPETMKRLLLIPLAALALAGASGCHFWKKSTKPKENTAIAADVAEGFRQRYVERRTAELVAKGAAASAARAQAEAEFKKQYGYIGPAGK